MLRDSGEQVGERREGGQRVQAAVPFVDAADGPHEAPVEQSAPGGAAQVRRLAHRRARRRRLVACRGAAGRTLRRAGGACWWPPSSTGPECLKGSASSSAGREVSAHDTPAPSSRSAHDAQLTDAPESAV